MPFQSNPYAAWQIAAAALMVLAGLTVRNHRSDAGAARSLSLALYAGSLWAFATAVEWLSPDPTWQRVWHAVRSAGVMIIPTAWFIFGVRLTGLGDSFVRRLGGWIWTLPAAFYLARITTSAHRLFYADYLTAVVGPAVVLEPVNGPLAYAHAGYSSILLLAGIAVIAVEAVRRGAEEPNDWIVFGGSKRAETDLLVATAEFRMVFDSLQDSYFEADPKGVVTYANRAFYENLGLRERNEVVGRNFRRFTDRQSVRTLYREFGRLYETGEAVPRFEYFFRTTDGTARPGEASISPIVKDGAVVGARGLIRDVSERIRAQELLQEAKEAAETRAAELGAINRVASEVSRTLDLEPLLQSVCEELTSIFPVRNAGVGLVSADGRHLRVVAFHARNPNEESILGTLLPLEGNQSAMDAITTKTTLVIEDAQNDPRVGPLQEISRARGTRSLMVVPIMTRGEAIGTIGMAASDPAYLFTPGEISLAETIASQIAGAVDNAQRHARTESALNVAERDLEIGRQIQSGFFPDRLPRIPGWEIAAEFKAARQVAGDFYDVFALKGSPYIVFVIADVCDKGVGAALFMVLFRSLLRAFATRSGDDRDVDGRLLGVIRATNDYIAEYHGRSNMFATLFLGMLDPRTGEFRYVNGGHEPPVILDRDGAITRRLAPTGPAVGLFAGMEFSVEAHRFGPGDCLVGYTDGTVDARDRHGRHYTEARLLANLANPWSSVFSMLFELDVDLRRHIGSQDQFDDITLIALRRKRSEDEAVHAVCRVAELDSLGELRQFVEEAATYSGLRPDDVFAFKLAADEICTNIVEHGYADRPPGLLSLTFEVEHGERARLTIRDDGVSFNPDDATAPDLTAEWSRRAAGGLGIHLVRAQMDSVVYTRTDSDVNELIVEKRLAEARDE